MLNNEIKSQKGQKIRAMPRNRVKVTPPLGGHASTTGKLITQSGESPARRTMYKHCLFGMQLEHIKNTSLPL